MINAAMETEISGSRNATFWHAGGWREPAVLATTLMVHVSGHGPRRVYVSKRSGRSYIKLSRKRIWLTDKQLEEAYEKAGANELR